MGVVVIDGSRRWWRWWDGRANGWQARWSWALGEVDRPEHVISRRAIIAHQDCESFTEMHWCFQGGQQHPGAVGDPRSPWRRGWRHQRWWCRRRPRQRLRGRHEWWSRRWHGRKRRRWQGWIRCIALLERAAALLEADRLIALAGAAVCTGPPAATVVEVLAAGGLGWHGWPWWICWCSRRCRWHKRRPHRLRRRRRVRDEWLQRHRAVGRWMVIGAAALGVAVGAVRSRTRDGVCPVAATAQAKEARREGRWEGRRERCWWDGRAQRRRLRDRRRRNWWPRRWWR